jgi:DNA-binding LytR/AlgR family response regulator
MKIRCVITDDEPFARKGLQGYVEKTDFLELVGICENAIELNSLLKEKEIDLVFLDIEMPYITGIEFLKSIKNPPKVIFTTAYEQYAIQGFDLEILDYLLKPISFERFLKACNKAHDYFVSKTAAQTDHIFIKVDNRIERVSFDDILYVQALENYIAIHTADRKLIAHSTLKMLQEKLPPKSFIQTHKSFIASINKIDSIEGNILHIGKAQVPVSKYLKEEVLEKILNNKLLRR